jgi:hypothetical protein
MFWDRNSLHCTFYVYTLDTFDIETDFIYLFWFWTDGSYGTPGFIGNYNGKR